MWSYNSLVTSQKEKYKVKEILSTLERKAYPVDTFYTKCELIESSVHEINSLKSKILAKKKHVINLETLIQEDRNQRNQILIFEELGKNHCEFILNQIESKNIWKNRIYTVHLKHFSQWLLDTSSDGFSALENGSLVRRDFLGGSMEKLTSYIMFHNRREKLHVAAKSEILDNLSSQQPLLLFDGFHEAFSLNEQERLAIASPGINLTQEIEEILFNVSHFFAVSQHGSVSSCNLSRFTKIVDTNFSEILVIHRDSKMFSSSIFQPSLPHHHYHHLNHYQQKGKMILEDLIEDPPVERARRNNSASFPPKEEKALNNRVLIIGETGIGKTSLISFICKEWAEDRLWKKKFVSCIWVIDLKYFPMWLLDASDYGCRTLQGGVMIDRLFPGGFLDKLSSYIYFSIIKETKGVSVSFTKQDILKKLTCQEDLLILDGFDQVFNFRHHEKYELDRARVDVLNELAVLLSSISNYIVCSRYSDFLDNNLQSITNSFSKVVEIYGFSEQSQLDYVRKYFRSEQQSDRLKVFDLIAFIEESPSIQEFCRIPMNVELLCYLWKSEQTHKRITKDFNLTVLYGLFEERLCDLYEERIMKSEELMEEKTRSSAVTAKHREILREIAFTGFDSNQVKVVSVTTIKNILKINEIEEESQNAFMKIIGDIGFLFPCFPNSKSRIQDHYFVSITFQEYLTAEYIRDKFITASYVVESFLEIHKYNPRYRQIFKFLAGLLFSFLSHKNEILLQPQLSSDEFMHSDSQNLIDRFLSIILRPTEFPLQKNDQFLLLMDLLSQLILSDKDIIFSSNRTFVLLKRCYSHVMDVLLTKALRWTHLFEETGFSVEHIRSKLESTTELVCLSCPEYYKYLQLVSKLTFDDVHNPTQRANLQSKLFDFYFLFKEKYARKKFLSKEYLAEASTENLIRCLKKIGENQNNICGTLMTFNYRLNSIEFEILLKVTEPEAIIQSLKTFPIILQNPINVCQLLLYFTGLNLTKLEVFKWQILDLMHKCLSFKGFYMDYMFKYMIALIERFENTKIFGDNPQTSLISLASMIGRSSQFDYIIVGCMDFIIWNSAEESLSRLQIESCTDDMIDSNLKDTFCDSFQFRHFSELDNLYDKWENLSYFIEKLVVLKRFDRAKDLLESEFKRTNELLNNEAYLRNLFTFRNNVAYLERTLYVDRCRRSAVFYLYKAVGLHGVMELFLLYIQAVVRDIALCYLQKSVFRRVETKVTNAIFRNEGKIGSLRNLIIHNLFCSLEEISFLDTSGTFIVHLIDLIENYLVLDSPIILENNVHLLLRMIKDYPEYKEKIIELFKQIYSKNQFVFVKFAPDRSDLNILEIFQHLKLDSFIYSNMICIFATIVPYTPMSTVVQFIQSFQRDQAMLAELPDGSLSKIKNTVNNIRYLLHLAPAGSFAQKNTGWLRFTFISRSQTFFLLSMLIILETFYLESLKKASPNGVRMRVRRVQGSGGSSALVSSYESPSPNYDCDVGTSPVVHSPPSMTVRRNDVVVSGNNTEDIANDICDSSLRNPLCPPTVVSSNTSCDSKSRYSANSALPLKNPMVDGTFSLLPSRSPVLSASGDNASSSPVVAHRRRETSPRQRSALSGKRNSAGFNRSSGSARGVAITLNRDRPRLYSMFPKFMSSSSRDTTEEMLKISERYFPHQYLLLEDFDSFLRSLPSDTHPMLDRLPYFSLSPMSPLEILGICWECCLDVHNILNEVFDVLGLTDPSAANTELAYFLPSIVESGRLWVAVTIHLLALREEYVVEDDKASLTDKAFDRFHRVLVVNRDYYLENLLFLISSSFPSNSVFNLSTLVDIVAEALRRLFPDEKESIIVCIEAHDWKLIEFLLTVYRDTRFEHLVSYPSPIKTFLNFSEQLDPYEFMKRIIRIYDSKKEFSASSPFPVYNSLRKRGFEKDQMKQRSVSVMFANESCKFRTDLVYSNHSVSSLTNILMLLISKSPVNERTIDRNVTERVVKVFQGWLGYQVKNDIEDHDESRISWKRFNELGYLVLQKFYSRTSSWMCLLWVVQNLKNLEVITNFHFHQIFFQIFLMSSIDVSSDASRKELIFKELVMLLHRISREIENKSGDRTWNPLLAAATGSENENEKKEDKEEKEEEKEEKDEGFGEDDDGLDEIDLDDCSFRMNGEETGSNKHSSLNSGEKEELKPPVILAGVAKNDFHTDRKNSKSKYFKSLKTAANAFVISPKPLIGFFNPKVAMEHSKVPSEDASDQDLPRKNTIVDEAKVSEELKSEVEDKKDIPSIPLPVPDPVNSANKKASAVDGYLLENCLSQSIYDEVASSHEWFVKILSWLSLAKFVNLQLQSVSWFSPHRVVLIRVLYYYKPFPLEYHVKKRLNYDWYTLREKSVSEIKPSLPLYHAKNVKYLRNYLHILLVVYDIFPSLFVHLQMQELIFYVVEQIIALRDYYWISESVKQVLRVLISEIPYDFYMNSNYLQSLLEDPLVFDCFRFLDLSYENLVKGLFQHLVSKNKLIVERSLRLILSLDYPTSLFEKAFNETFIDLSRIHELEKNVFPILNSLHFVHDPNPQNYTKRYEDFILFYNKKKFSLSERMAVVPLLKYFLPLVPSTKRYHCFLSHDWGFNKQNHEKVSVINEALISRGIITWFDSNQMKNDMIKDMEDGIMNSMCMMIFITENYQKKILDGEVEARTSNIVNNCYFEFDKGHQLNVRRISIVMEQSMVSPPLWQGRLKELTNFKYVDMAAIKFSDIEKERLQLNEKCDEIFGKLRDFIKEEKNRKL
jgi:hypothetical protein